MRIRSGTATVFVAGTLILFAACTKAPTEKPACRFTVVSQSALGERACSPSALFHALVNGSQELRDIAESLPGKTPEERIRSLMNTESGKPSILYGKGRRRYSDQHGETCVDLLETANELLTGRGLSKASGKLLDRTKGEPLSKHLSRIRGYLTDSLRAGFPPIVEVRAMAARKSETGYTWTDICAHTFTVLEMQPQSTASVTDMGFWIRIADSTTGQVDTVFVHVQGCQTFLAPKEFTVSNNGEEQWTWASEESPFLEVTVPTTTYFRDKEPAIERTLIFLRYAIVREPTKYQAPGR
jgi:hypothetical protein